MHVNEGWFLKDEAVVPDDDYSTVKAHPFHLSLVYLHYSACEDWYVDAVQSTSLQTQVGVDQILRTMKTKAREAVS
jgi:hypothetical protein